MIDIHCHILPEIDDGAENLEMSLAMAKQAVEDGVTHIVVTPHFRPPYDYDLQLQLREERLATLRAALAEKQLPLTLLKGAEVQTQEYPFKELLVRYPQLLIPGSTPEHKTVLLELPLDMAADRVKDIYFLAQLYHTDMILAHPERQPNFLNNVSALKELLEHGLMLQFNATSIRKGFFRRRMNRGILELMAAAPEQVFLASDAHEPEERPCRLSPASEVILPALGEEAWQMMTESNPRRVLGL